MNEFRRMDMSIRGNGPLCLGVGRTYNNWSQNNSLNESGQSPLGPKWHLNYEMRLESASGADDLLLRTETGTQRILYYQGPDGQGRKHWRSDALNGAGLDCVRETTGFTVTTPDPSQVIRFNTTGTLASMRSANGYMISFTYDGSDRLSRAAFDHENPAKSVDDRYIEFDYTTTDTVTRLTRVRTNDGHSVSYCYDTSDTLAGVINEHGEVIEAYINGSMGTSDEMAYRHIREVKAMDAEGNLQTVRTYDYDDFWWGGYKLKTIYDGAGTQFMNISLSEQDSYVRTLTYANGLKIQYKFDYNRNPEEVTWLDGNNGDAVLKHVSQSFVSNDRLMRPSHLYKTLVDANGTTTTYTYLGETDPNAEDWDWLQVQTIAQADGTTTTYEYDSDRQVTQITNEPGNRVTSYAYDSEGNRTSMTNVEGNTWYYTYDDYGRLVKTEDPTSATTEIAYNTIGHVTVTTNSEGRAALREYDADNRLTSVTALGVTTTYAYDSRDRLTTVTDGGGNATVTEYDGLNRRITVTDPLGHTTRYVYNTTGTLQNVIAADDSWTTYTYDFWGRLVEFTDQRGKSTGYTYDIQGRTLTEKNPLNQTTTYVYNDTGCQACGASAGQLYSITDPASRTTYYEYDENGHVKKITYSGSTDYVEFGYDSLGRRTTMRDTRLPASDLGSQTFAWAYDARDRVTSETYPDGKSIQYGYDVLGRRVTMTDPDDNVTTYTYANTATNKKLYVIRHSLMGSTSYYYDSSGRLWQEVYPTGAYNLWEYDSVNRVSSIENWDMDVGLMNEEVYTYNANSMRTRIDFSSDYVPGYHKLYAYDNVLRLTEEHERAASENASLYRYAYTYDDAGNRTEMVHFDGTSTGTTAYTYNDGNQLTLAEGPGGVGDDIAYGFDSNGNMISSRESAQYTGKDYAHNRENRLVGVYAVDEEETTTTLATYTYDALGRRIMRTDASGNMLLYYYDGLNILMVKEKPSGCSSWRTKNVYALKQASIGQIISERTYGYSACSTTPSSWFDTWYHFDLLGNTTCLTDSNGWIADKSDMEAFGTVVSGMQQGFHLTTKQYDVDAGLYFFNARWYAINICRFIESDPLGLTEGPNAYTLTENSPSVAVDPTGMEVAICCRPMNCIKLVNHCYVRIDGGIPEGVHGKCWDTATTQENSHAGPGEQCYDSSCPPGADEKVRACMYEQRGVWFPGLNDCDTRVNKCLRRAGCKARVSRFFKPYIIIW